MELTRSRFTENFIRINSLSFNKWVFDAGMHFHSEIKWWGDKGLRDGLHNGLDLLAYETGGGLIKTIGPGTKVPIIYAGQIVRRLKDFLGHSLFATHEIYSGDSRLFTVYGHVDQANDIAVGQRLSEGSVIASVSDPENTKVPAHLHLSIGLMPKTFPVEDITWKALDEDRDVRFFDPADVI